MTTVKKIGEDKYHVEDFLASQPHIECVVLFEKGEARVVDRTNTTESIWDKRAIAAVQYAIQTETVK